MENQNIQINSSKINLSELRLPANYGATLGVKKVVNSVYVGKPKKSQFFQVHNSLETKYLAMEYEQKDNKEWYLVHPSVANQISELVRSIQLLVGIDRQGNSFLIPVILPGEDGRWNSWHESLARACEFAKSKWIRIASNRSAGGYDVYEAQGDLPSPDWPECGMDEMVEIAFRGKIINHIEHPVVQSILGRV